MAKYLLAHDLGTSGNKATLYSTEGALVKSTTYHYGLKVTNGNHAEQNPMDWWRACCETTRQLISEVDPADVVAVSFSGQMMGCLCVDKNGDPIRDSLIWADMRSTPQEKQIRERMTEKHFYETTGHRISSSYSATKLMWIKDNEPEVYAKTYKMLNAKDFLIFKLTGSLVTEPSDASSTCLMDLNTLKWSEEMFDVCGLDINKMPEIIPSVAVAGKITAEASKLCGLLEGTPVVCGGGDGSCAAVGTGTVSEGKAYCCLGTSSWISYASKTPVYDPDMTTFNFAHIVPGYVTPIGTMQTGGGALSWAVDQFCTFGLKPEEINKKVIYDNVCKAVAESPVGAKGLLFLPYLIGERSPRWNDKAKGTFVGLTMEHTMGEILRSVMEGVSMNLSLVLDAFRKGGAHVDTLMMIGGGARNEIWRQIFADVLGVTVQTPNYLEEATSMGAAITAGVGVGVFKDFNVIDKFLKTENSYQPNLANAEAYEKQKRLFDECYYALTGVFKSL